MFIPFIHVADHRIGLVQNLRTYIIKELLVFFFTSGNRFVDLIIALETVVIRNLLFFDGFIDDLADVKVRNQGVEFNSLIRLFLPYIISFSCIGIFKYISVVQNKLQEVLIGCGNKFSLFRNNRLLVFVCVCFL